ncbi:TrbC/VirB2 family protein [Burkholderia alba]|uniref:TrbC/VirB2 family protein n=1 Tax=Burkholderia alba TaxID=2683677 RepID=UPI002B05F6B5|nr:TrbC/VirB2 family protein [Burkholderia alba]
MKLMMNRNFVRPARGVALMAALATLLASHAAVAGGGLQAGTSAVSNFQVWLYGFIGVLAICYLLWVGVQCFSNKADWVHDFGGGVAKVAAVGGAVVLATWAWGLFA